MRCAKAILGLAVLGLATPVAQAQGPRFLLRDGDPVIGIGAIDKLDFITVVDSGMWLAVVEAGTDNLRDSCLLRNGFLNLREAMTLPFPVGSTVSGWGSIDMASNGDLGLVIRVKLSGSNTSNDYLFWNLATVAAFDEVLNVPGFGPNCQLKAVRVARINSDRTMIALVKVLNPTVENRNVDALMRFRMDAQGNVISREVLGTKRMNNDALETFIEELGSPNSPEHSLSVNQRGDFVLPVNGFGRKVIMKNMDTIVAQELLPAPVPGRTFGGNAFVLSKVCINDRGDIAYTASLTALNGNPADPTNFLVVLNDQKFVQSGDVVPALSQSSLAKGTPIIIVSNRGDVFWRAQPISTAGAGSAFMRNFEPLIQESVTVVEGNQVNQVTNAEDCFAVSPEGRFMIGRAVLQTIGNALLYVDFGLVTELPGCLGLNQGSLLHLAGEPRVGQQIQIGMDDGPFPGALPLFFFSRRSVLNASGCGVASSIGELMLAPPFSNLFILPAWDGVNPSVFTVNVPNSLALANTTFYLQGVFGNPNQPTSFQLTNGLKFEIGPP